MNIKDQLNRKINLQKTPKSIVSLVPSQTELLYDLGLESSIVGITKFCVHPNHFKVKKTIVGGTKQVNFKKIANLSPDIIICNKEENTKDMVVQLEKIAPVWVSDIYTVEDNNQMIKFLGEVFDISKKASLLIDAINIAKQDFEIFMKEKPSKRVSYIIWKNPFMVAGRATFINELLQLNKFENCIKDKSSRYPEATIENFINSELILLSTEPFPFKEKDVLELKNELQKEVRLVDGEYFSWYGSRLAKSFTYFKTLH